MNQIQVCFYNLLTSTLYVKFFCLIILLVVWVRWFRTVFWKLSRRRRFNNKRLIRHFFSRLQGTIGRFHHVLFWRLGLFRARRTAHRWNIWNLRMSTYITLILETVAVRRLLVLLLQRHIIIVFISSTLRRVWLLRLSSHPVVGLDVFLNVGLGRLINLLD